jgi:plasmid stabilization system protein ParE
MAEIVWTKNAAKCLEDIHTYIFDKNQSAAHKVVEGIYNKIQLLETFPLIGQWYRSEEDGEIRTLIYGNYKVAYQIKANDSVHILGIFHGAMEIEKYLKLEDK